MATLETTKTLLSMISLTNPNLKTLHPANYRAYHAILKDIPEHVLRQAVNNLVQKDIDFFPSAGKILQLCLDIISPIPEQADIDLQWRRVQELASDVDPSKQPDYQTYREAISACGGIWDIRTANQFQAEQQRKIFAGIMRKRADEKRKLIVGSTVKQIAEIAVRA